MAEIKAGEPFGLDPDFIKKIDWKLALSRVNHDLRSDFIYAPHLAFIYAKAGEELISRLTSALNAGTFSPGVPITLEVPKSFKIRVAVTSHRLGPNFSRPGSILLPNDRLFYQALADQAAPIIKMETDLKRSFSHHLAAPNNANMFEPTRVCWNKLQNALSKYSKTKDVNYIMKIDIANFFGSINQHELINVLNDSGYSPSLSSRLEAMLTRYTGERSSRGILQGMYPSDLFGNYYLAPIDIFLDDLGIPSARYVDDMYIFLKNVDEAEYLLRELIPTLRSYNLIINEAKSSIMPKTALMTEEPDLEALFSDAVKEISEQINEDDFDVDYGFQSEWEEEELGIEDLELKATTLLFDSIDEYTGHEENIERFCLPLFSKANSNYAIQHVMDSFKKRPSMSQIYAAYLAKFLYEENVVHFLLDILQFSIYSDWQKMWVLAALTQAASSDDGSVKSALTLLNDANRHDALRAIAAIYVGRFGDHTRRKALNKIYPNVSTYIQSAIYFSSREWPKVERQNAKANWGGHSDLHSLITIAMKP